MQKLGLIGGMSWESTQTYYQLLNRLTRDALGGLHSANILLWSFDFAEIAKAQSDGDWEKATELMVEAALNLKKGGAEILMICTNTMHKMAPAIEAASALPLVHIADVTGDALKKRGAKKPLLLATRYTMEQDFYKGRIEDKFGISVDIPEPKDRDEVHRIIYEELCQGQVLEGSKKTLKDMLVQYQKAGCDAVILGCTEIGLILNDADTDMMVFDTTLLHAKAGLEAALKCG